MNTLLNYFVLGTIGTDIYTGGDNKVNEAIMKIIKLVGGVGGGAFTLAVLVIALVIIFGSISSQKMRTVWITFISCVAGAFLFYSAYYLAPTIANIAQ